jgi:hypothetical protein
VLKGRKKEENSIICNNVDGLEGHYSKGSKPFI